MPCFEISLHVVLTISEPFREGFLGFLPRLGFGGLTLIDELLRLYDGTLGMR